MQRTRLTGRRIISIILSIMLLGILIAVDQITKYYFKDLFDSQGTTVVIDNFFSFTYVENDGAAWSFLSGVSWAQTFFKVLTGFSLILFGVFYYYAFVKDYKWLKVSLILIIAGTVGNFIDRLLLNYVIDFLAFEFWGWAFPVFNFADSCLCVGVVMLIIHYCFIDKDTVFKIKKKNYIEPDEIADKDLNDDDNSDVFTEKGEDDAE